MTLRDPEVIEALRDEPELLALADALADTQRPQRRRVRRLAPRVTAVAAAVAAIAAVVLLWPSGGGNNRILGRALAAIGDGPVLHLLVQLPTGGVLVNLDSGERVVEKMQIESWSDRDFERAHLVMRFGGRAGDLLLPEDASKPGVTVGSVDPAYAAFWTGYRQALANGDAKLEGEDTVAGQAVYWLRFPSVEQGRPGTEVAIDRQTYKPVPPGRVAAMTSDFAAADSPVPPNRPGTGCCERTATARSDNARPCCCANAHP